MPQPSDRHDIAALYARALALRREGDPAEAASVLRRILSARPDTPEALFQLGRIEAEAGDTGAAKEHLRAALRLKPKEAAIWQALHATSDGSARRRLERDAARAGIALGVRSEAAPILALISRDAAAAEARALALVKTAPEAFWPACALGRARLAQGRWSAALGPLEVAHTRDSGDASLQVDLGLCLARLDRPLRAEALLLPHTGQATALGARARLVLARLRRETLRPEAALAALDMGPSGRKPTAPECLERALALAATGRGAEADEALEEAVSAGAARVQATHAVLDTLQEGGAAATAQDLLDRAAAHDPQETSFRVRRAQSRQSNGAFAEADDDLRAAFALDPRNAEAFRAWTAARKMRADDPILPALEVELRRADMPAPARRVLNFAAAKAFWDLGRIDEAFASLERGNRLMFQAYPHSIEADLAEARALVADWLRLSALAPDAPLDPVLFVTGLPRSGTTLVETILSAHPQVAAGGEMPFLSRALTPVFEGLRHGTPEPEQYARAGTRYLEAARRRAGGTLVADKAISTFSRIGHAARALPGARFVVLRRDPRDVGLSMYRNMFPEGLHRYTNDLAAMGRYIRLHDALVAFWADALPDRVHIVDYEALTGDPEEQIRALLTFCGLPWDPACMHPEAVTRRVDTLSFAQVRAPIGRASVALWERHAERLAPLISALSQDAPSLRMPGTD